MGKCKEEDIRAECTGFEIKGKLRKGEIKMENWSTSLSKFFSEKSGVYARAKIKNRLVYWGGGGVCVGGGYHF